MRERGLGQVLGIASVCKCTPNGVRGRENLPEESARQYLQDEVLLIVANQEVKRIWHINDSEQAGPVPLKLNRGRAVRLQYALDSDR